MIKQIFKILFFILFSFNLLVSVSCSGDSSKAVKKEPPTDPDTPVSGIVFIADTSTITNPGFIIRQLPDSSLTVSLYQGLLLTSSCSDSHLILLNSVSVDASETEIAINPVLNLLKDRIYKFFAKIEGEGISTACLELDYIIDTIAPRIVTNTLNGTDPMENDDTPRMSKIWTWSCIDRDGTSCEYRYKIDDNLLTGTSCPIYTFASNETYSNTATATKTGDNGKYCIHIQAKDEAGNESSVTSVYATLDNTSPTISGVTIPSKTYAGEGQMDFTVTLSESITVTGTPRISMTFDGGGSSQTKYAEYYQGSGSTSLIFRYQVAEADSDGDGIEIINSIDLNSGTLLDGAGNSVDLLTFTLPTNLSDVLVSGSDPNVILSLTNLSVDENGDTGTYKVRLNSKPTHPVTVALRSADTGVATVSPRTLTFEVNDNNGKIWSNPQTVTITGVSDDIDNDVGGGSSRTANITHTVTSTGQDYSGLTVSPVGVTSRDDDDIGSIQLTVDPTSIDEHDDTSSNTQANNTETITVTAEFQGSTSGGNPNSSVRLPDDVTITTSVGAGTAQAADFNAVSNFNIDIPAGDSQSSQRVGSFDLTVVDDRIDDDNEALLVKGSTSLGLIVNSTTLAINDNDEKGVTISQSSSLSVPENGGTGTYTVQLETQPAETVIVHIVSSDPGVATVAPATLSFEVNDNNGKIWSNPQTVTITGVDDNIDNGTGNNPQRTTNITHNVVSVDTVYHGITVDSVDVTSQDDDGLAESTVILSQSSLSFHEGDEVTYTVQLESAPTTNVTVTLTSDDTTVATVTPATLDFEVDDSNSKIWSNPQTVTVTGVTDSTSENNRETTVTHQIAGEMEKTLTATVFHNLTSVLESDGDGSDLPNDNTTRGQVAVGGSATGDLSIPGDKDRFAVYLKKDRYYQILLLGAESTPWSGGSLHDAYLRVYSSSNTEVDENDDGYDGETLNSILDFVPNSDGTYYLSAGTYGDGINGEYDTGTYTLAVEDKTLNPPKIQFDSSTYSVTEGGDVTVTVTLSKASGGDTGISILVTDVSTDSNDYTLSESSLFFWSETSATFTITAIDDSTSENPEELLLTFGTLPTGMTAGPQDTATVTITDQ